MRKFSLDYSGEKAFLGKELHDQELGGEKGHDALVLLMCFVLGALWRASVLGVSLPWSLGASNYNT